MIVVIHIEVIKEIKTGGIIMGRLFGTDGARGVANKELTCELAMNIGRAAAMVLTENSDKKPVFVIGKDTRLRTRW